MEPSAPEVGESKRSWASRWGGVALTVGVPVASLLVAIIGLYYTKVQADLTREQLEAATGHADKPQAPKAAASPAVETVAAPEPETPSAIRRAWDWLGTMNVDARWLLAQSVVTAFGSVALYLYLRRRHSAALTNAVSATRAGVAEELGKRFVLLERERDTWKDKTGSALRSLASAIKRAEEAEKRPPLSPDERRIAVRARMDMLVARGDELLRGLQAHKARGDVLAKAGTPFSINEDYHAMVHSVEYLNRARSEARYALIDGTLVADLPGEIPSNLFLRIDVISGATRGMIDWLRRTQDKVHAEHVRLEFDGDWSKASEWADVHAMAEALRRGPNP